MIEPDALKEMDNERIESKLPDRPVTSLRDLEVLYGNLYALGRGLTSEYGPYLSPDAATEQVGGENLLVVYVDLRADNATLGNPPVKRRMYPQAEVERVAHAKFEAARGVDHSITHQSGQSNGAEKQADHAKERLTRWPTEDAVQEVSAVHEDGWLIEALVELGNDDDALTTIEEAVHGLVHDETQLLVTVAFAFEDGLVSTTDVYRPDEDWHYPGEIEVLQEAMAARKTAKFRAKNRATDAVGDGTCYVGDGDEPVYGVVDDPMKFYLSKQMEKFPRFDPDAAWQTQGLSRDAAIAVQNATTFLDACNVSAPGISAYYLPYVTGTLDARDGQLLYEALARQELAVGDDEGGSTPVARLARAAEERGGDLNRLRFYFLAIHKYQKDRWRLLANEPNATVHIPEQLARNHLDTLNSWVFREGSVFPIRDNFPLLSMAKSSPESLLDLVASVGYFAATCFGEDTDDPSSEDFRFRATASIAGNTPLNAEELFSEYVARIMDRFEPDSKHPFPDAIVASQYVQYSALTATDLIVADDEQLEEQPRYMTNDTKTPAANNRVEQFDQFVEDHPVLNDEVRRGIFSLGALVGRLSRYQRTKDRTMTAVKTYPVDNLTRNNVTRIATEVTDKNIIYSDEDKRKGTMFAELMDEIVDGLLSGDPDDWRLSTDDLRFHYAMGIAYGLNDRTTMEYDNE